MRPEDLHSDVSSRTEQLVDHAKAYAGTTFELFRLKAIDKLSAASGAGLAWLILMLVFILVLFMLSIGSALWISEIMDSRFSCFFIVSLFYLLVGLIVYIGRDSLIKKPVSNKIINELMND